MMAVIGIAAGLLLAVGAGYAYYLKTTSVWQLAGRRIAVGQTIETGSQAGALIEATKVGQVELDPNSRLQILPMANGNQQFSLQRGTLHALIWAPPTRFVVETPSARTIDLGCAYTLTVLTDNSGLLKVETGWVAFQAGPRESFIPAGAACRTRPGKGPGLPYFEDSSAAFQTAVSDFDQSGGRTDVKAIVHDARKRDALTLWHLILRTSDSDRELAVRGFDSLVPGADVAGLQAGSAKAIDQAWDLLGLGQTEWWRMWKHGWQL
jgi:hypothetical protein